MQSRPVIGIPTQTLQSLGGAPAEFPPSWVMSQRYIVTLTAAGALPWMVPLVAADEATLRGIYEQLDGIFLPGGADIDPASYREERHPLCDKTDPPRDRVELLFASWAMDERKPVLGVCRGVQIMNLAAGGTLWQDLAELRTGSIKHDYFPFSGKYARDYLAHEVTVTPGTRLATILGDRRVMVNSMHHQGINHLGGRLVASAVAPDGLVEAVEDTGAHFFLGVQWHPEALTDTDPRMRRLFEAFVSEARSWRESERLAPSV